ncbi:MAG: AMP-binding protein [Sphaerochaetaceae bacterium]|nr:AMP-binding protein [Sphaerochaetaceae bacterium]MDD3941031.1 AMP-binding protein [Sphaerochaetaceae bacterium]
MARAWDVLESYRGTLFEGDWPSICHMFLITMESHADSKAFTILDEGGTISLTYRQAYRRILDVASYLSSKGIGKGDRIMLNGKNSPQWAIAYLGILFCGATVVPLDNQMPTERVEALSAFSEAKGIFADRDVIDKLTSRTWPGSQDIIIYLDAEGDGKGMGCAQIPGGGPVIETSRLPDGEDVAAILYTSGTTGNEKGVLLTHANFTSDVYQAGDPEFLSITSDDVFYALLPLHHSYTMTAVFLESIMHGCELLFGQGIVVSRVLNEMRTGKVTLFLAIPLLYNKLLAGLMRKVRERGIATYAFIRSLMWLNGLVRKTFHVNPGRRWFHQLLDGIGMVDNKLCICGGGPLSPSTFRQYQQLGLDFIQGYGLTEAAPILTLNPVGRFKVTSVGKVFPLVDMRIADADLLGVGEVQVKGPNICKGYFKDPVNTALLFTEDGYLRTGDLGALDKEGYLYLKGRAKNLIVTEGGKNVYPEEIEDLFQRYVQIEQVLVRAYIANKAARVEGIEAVIYPDMEHYKQLGYDARQIALDIDRVVSEVNKKLAVYKKVTRTTVIDKPMAMTSTKKIQRGKVSRTLERLRGNS